MLRQSGLRKVNPETFKGELQTSLKYGLQMTLLLPPVSAISESGGTPSGPAFGYKVNADECVHGEITSDWSSSCPLPSLVSRPFPLFESGRIRVLHVPFFEFLVAFPLACTKCTQKTERPGNEVTLFHCTSIRISAEWHPYLGSAIGQTSFVEDFVAAKVSIWKEELDKLSKIAQTQPLAAFLAFTHDIMSKWAISNAPSPTHPMSRGHHSIKLFFLNYWLTCSKWFQKGP